MIEIDTNLHGLQLQISHYSHYLLMWIESTETESTGTINIGMIFYIRFLFMVIHSWFFHWLKINNKRFLTKKSVTDRFPELPEQKYTPDRQNRLYMSHFCDILVSFIDYPWLSLKKRILCGNIIRYPVMVWFRKWNVRILQK